MKNSAARQLKQVLSGYLVVGIDPHKKKHAAVAITGDLMVRTKFKFANSRVGFEQALQNARAEMVAEVLLTGDFTETKLPQGVYADLRGAHAAYFRLVKERTRIINLLKGLLDGLFPEWIFQNSPASGLSESPDIASIWSAALVAL